MAVRLFPSGVPKSKRVLDLLVAVPGLILLSPIVAGIALLVRATHGKPVLFRQVRPGYKGEPFSILKFRTMTDRRDDNGDPLPDAARLTRLGQALRASSLDELPSLLNVVRGEMSIVGPRPLLVQYLERYTAAQARRHDVLPGVTGWTQVQGRNALNWDDKLDFDVWYVDHRSLGLDLKIIYLTVWKVLRREGISQPGHATAEEFMGSGGT